MAKSHTPKSETRDFSDFEQEIVQGLLSGQPLAGKDGVLAGLIGYVTEKVMDAELSEHLQRQAE